MSNKLCQKIKKIVEDNPAGIKNWAAVLFEDDDCMVIYDTIECAYFEICADYDGEIGVQELERVAQLSYDVNGLFHMNGEPDGWFDCDISFEVVFDDIINYYWFDRKE